MASNGRTGGQWSAAASREPISLRQGPNGINLSSIDPTPQEIDKSMEISPQQTHRKRRKDEVRRINAIWDRTGMIPR